MADLTSAGDWYELQLPGLGLDLADEVQRGLNAIAERPETWPIWPASRESDGIRRFLLARFPFAIGYVLEGDEVVVLAIAHLRRRPSYWLARVAAGR